MEIAKPINVKISCTYAQKDPLIARSTFTTTTFLQEFSNSEKDLLTNVVYPKQNVMIEFSSAKDFCSFLACCSCMFHFSLNVQNA